MEEHNSSLSPEESAAAHSAFALRDLQQRAQAALASSREQAARLEAEITQQLDAIAATLHEQTSLESQTAVEADALHAQIARLSEELERSRVAWLAERAELERQRGDLSQKLADAEATRDDLVQKTTDLERQRDDLTQRVNGLESEKNSLSEKSTSFEAAREDLSQKLVSLEAERAGQSQAVAALEAQIQSSQAEWRKQLLDFENRLRDQQGSWNEQRSEWTQARAVLERERDELQQKFDLALQDLQRLRARVAEAEQDLARRPESNQADSAELVALRAERDALAARVEELEQQPATHIDPNVEQQMSDLQRRFELAVEDVRELKTKNAKLESQLAAAGSQPRSQTSDPGGNDWESQKRRLLASLEESSDAHESPVQKQQRITIEGTVAMTDAVVAEKDRQIAELKAQLAAAGIGSVADAERDRKTNELIEADEVIAEHRKRVRELEREMQEKLRAAELEMSVERAKMARQKAELDELKSDLESKRQQFETSGGPSAPGQPKRRWRDKLGLSGDE
jgi:chromosome segregation ATPase